MKNLIIIMACLALTNVYALKSPFSSTVEGITVKNTHFLDLDGRILRGMAPLGKTQELIDYGVSDILIFKNQTRKEIDQELEELRENAFNLENVIQIDFLWHDYPSYEESCKQTIKALRLMNEVSNNTDRKLFLHCTVGEDRTGMLAGLWRMLDQGWSKSKAFKEEMCLNGYEAGNANKPRYVINEIRSDLTPLFEYMAYLITSGRISKDKLVDYYCKNKIRMKSKLKCRKSPRFPEEN